MRGGCPLSAGGIWIFFLLAVLDVRNVYGISFSSGTGSVWGGSGCYWVSLLCSISEDDFTASYNIITETSTPTSRDSFGSPCPCEAPVAFEPST